MNLLKISLTDNERPLGLILIKHVSEILEYDKRRVVRLHYPIEVLKMIQENELKSFAESCKLIGWLSYDDIIKLCVWRKNGFKVESTRCDNFKQVICQARKLHSLAFSLKNKSLLHRLPQVSMMMSPRSFRASSDVITTHRTRTSP